LQWLIDIIKEWCAAQGYLTQAYVDRGFSAAVDFELADLDDDGNWHDLVLPGFIDKAARAVHLTVDFRAEAINRFVLLGGTNMAGGQNYSRQRSQVANVRSVEPAIVRIEPVTRKIQYLISAVGVTYCNIHIRGWWL